MSISRKVLFPMLIAMSAAALEARSTVAPPVRRSAVPTDDGGLTCNACHRGTDLNGDARGRMVLEASDYRPGVKQTLRIIMEHPTAIRWGFQLTARQATNTANKAGVFTQSSDVRVMCNATAQMDGVCPEGEVEFASHQPNQVKTGERNRVTWTVEWTPPASGDVIFYLAGNAADGTGTNANDSIYAGSVTVKQQNCSLGKPTISGVRNAASGAEGPFSFNTLVAIFGSGLQAAGTARQIAASDFNDGRFPTSISCLAVEVNNVRAPITFAGAGQVNAQIPTISASGQVRVVAVANPGLSNEQRSDPATIVLGGPSPAFFMLPGTNAIIAQVAGTTTLIANPSNQLQGSRPGRAGDVITLYATGLGATEPIYQAGEVPSEAKALAARPVIEWGGRALDAADILYAGTSPGSVSGLYQINLRIPTFASAGNNVVRIRQGSALSADNASIFIGN